MVFWLIDSPYGGNTHGIYRFFVFSVLISQFIGDDFKSSGDNTCVVFVLIVIVVGGLQRTVYVFGMIFHVWAHERALHESSQR